MEIRVIGIDLGKTVFHFLGVNTRGEGMTNSVILIFACKTATQTFRCPLCQLA